MRGAQSFLFRQGLTNADSEDVSAYTTFRVYESVAYCNSQKCYTERYCRSGYGTVKEVSIHATNCPDCGSALYWRTRPRKEKGSE